MDIKEEGKGEEEGYGNLRSLGAVEFLTQEAEQGRTMLVDTHIGFNELSRLAMLWTLRHRWPDEAKHWAQLLLRHTWNITVTILIQDGVTHRELILMVLYGITLVLLADELRAADPGILSPF